MICRHFGTCGGCEWQDVAYAAQLDRKRTHLQALLREALGQPAPRVRPTIGQAVGPDGMPWHFRHKAAFVFANAPRPGRGTAGLTMGHFARGSNEVIPVEECPVHGDRANRLAFALRDHLARAGIPAAGPRLQGLLRHVIVRTSRDEREAVVMLVVTRNDRILRAPIRAFLASADPPTGFLLNVHDRPGPFMVGRETIRLHGRSHVRERILDAQFLVSPTAFFQTSPDAADLLVREVLAGTAKGRVGPGARAGTARAPLAVLDLYAGSGLFAVPLAAAGHVVTAVEENADAVRDGIANGRLNGAAGDRLRFLCARVEDAFPRLARRSFDLVVLDPPRQGTPPRVLEGVFTGLSPARAVYVSCNPEALAGELPRIVKAGYRIERVQPVDMFPHTSHIETVVSLGRREPRPSSADTDGVGVIFRGKHCDEK